MSHWRDNAIHQGQWDRREGVLQSGTIRSQVVAAVRGNWRKG